MSVAIGRMDPGMKAAVLAAGGLRPLARRLGIRHPAVMKMRTCPQDRVFEMADKTGLDPLTLRPDLEDWIFAEKVRRRLHAARLQHSLVRAAIPGAEGRTLEDGVHDILISLAAARFAARERGMPLAAVMTGRAKREAGARAWAMALAVVVGRARAKTVGVMFGTSRQNVDNAAERYLRARDGDDPEDFLEGEWKDGKARVLERGRARPVKTAEGALWDAEGRFQTLILGDDERGDG